MFYTTLCAIVKNEQASLREWLSYHVSIGFEHIVLYDNGSHPPVADFLRDLDPRLVTCISFPYEENQQLSAYFHCLKTFKERTVWLAFLDCDEFLLPLKDQDIKDVLDRYRDYSALAVHWKMFSSNGHISRPQDGVLQAYTQSLGLNAHVKSIVQPKRTSHPLSPHHFAYSSGFCVNEDYFCVPGPFSYPVGQSVVINHYYYKSQQDFEEKIERGLATKVKGGKNRSLSSFYRHLALPTEPCDAVLRLLERVRLIPFAELNQAAARMASQTDLAQLSERCLVLLQHGRLAAAEKVYEILVRHDGGEHVYLLGAELRLKQKRFDQAMQLLAQGHALFPESDKLFYTVLSKLYLARGQEQVAHQLADYCATSS